MNLTQWNFQGLCYKSFPFIFQTGWQILPVQDQKQDGFKERNTVKCCFCPCVLAQLPHVQCGHALLVGREGWAQPCSSERLQGSQAPLPSGRSTLKWGMPILPVLLCVLALESQPDWSGSVKLISSSLCADKSHLQLRIAKWDFPRWVGFFICSSVPCGLSFQTIWNAMIKTNKITCEMM